jgi:hypothetical protein
MFLMRDRQFLKLLVGSVVFDAKFGMNDRSRFFAIAIGNEL